MCRIGRRCFLKGLGGISLAAIGTQRSFGVTASGADDVVESIAVEALDDGRHREEAWAWFHPRACMVPTKGGPVALMTVQRISGSDYFWPVQWQTSADLGKTWTEPAVIPGLGRHDTDTPGLAEGVCDVSPDYHEATKTTLAMGHNVYYRGGHLARPQGPRWPVYVVRDADGNWLPAKKLAWDDPRGSQIYTSNCGQRVMLTSGDILLPLSFGNPDWPARRVSSALCSFDGRTVAIKEVGNELINNARRGLLEPSLVEFGGRFFMTIRAEDDRGYVSRSDDGLRWQEQKAWAWDDGRPLTMSTTQQHWLAHGDALFLVYTRKAEANANVFRWRAPIYMAQVDPGRLCLLRATERVVLPMIGDGINRPNHVARMGNFHVTDATTQESWVTVGESLPNDGWRGNLLLARIRWRF